MNKIDYIIVILIIILIVLSTQLFAGFIKKSIHPHNRIDNPNMALESNKLIVYGEYRLGSSVGKSMFPLFFRNATSIDIIPSLPDEVYIGDVITFNNNKDEYICHRVVGIKEDKQGIYFITKGDNNYIKDKYKVRFKDIERVTVGVLW